MPLLFQLAAQTFELFCLLWLAVLHSPYLAAVKTLHPLFRLFAGCRFSWFGNSTKTALRRLVSQRLRIAMVAERQSHGFILTFTACMVRWWTAYLYAAPVVEVGASKPRPNGFFKEHRQTTSQIYNIFFNCQHIYQYLTPIFS